MRAWSLTFCVLLLAATPVLSGCLSWNEAPPPAVEAPKVDVGSIVVPEGAELIEETGRAILRWANVTLPFREEVQLPAGATIVRTSGTYVDEGDIEQRIQSYMSHSDTGRRRCNPDVADTAWNRPVVGTHTCSGMTALDRPGENWTVRVTGLRDVDVVVDVVFEAAPQDGLTSGLDLTQLSMRDHALQETTYGHFESFDGTKLWYEVTLPEGEGPWPTVIAASPYNGITGRLGQEPGATPAMWTYWTQDWAERGYAAINVDVRGFGLSDGCVEVWSENEQLDQVATVDWVAEQPWSDGRIGFYGQSYVATTPLAAASHAAEELDAVIMVAPVINAYEDWHYGGVPNGENAGSPVAYQVLTDAPLHLVPSVPPSDEYMEDLTRIDPVGIAKYSAVGLCDATMLAEANDPRGIYDAFYEERDFKKMVKNIKAATLFTEGFEDANVKSQMIPQWFNEVEAPKLGLFGHWVHQHPTRADEEILFLGWMDQYVKGRELGFETLPAVEVTNNLEQTRRAEAWPDDSLPLMVLAADYAAGKLAPRHDGEPAAVDLVLAPADGMDELLSLFAAGPFDARQVVTATYPVEAPFAFSGIARLDVHGTLQSQGNAYLAAALYDVDEEGRRDLITYGMRNLAHNEDNTRYEPVVDEEGTYPIRFLPTEYVFQKNHTMVIELRAVQALRDGLALPGQPGVFTVVGEENALSLPIVDLDAYATPAATAQR